MLPEKWCIKITSESKLVLQEADIIFEKGYDYTMGAYYSPSYPDCNQKGWQLKNREHTEISLEYFKRFILNKEYIPLIFN